MPEDALATTAEWQALARIDPLYVVSSWPGKRGAWNRDDFYAMGVSDWEDFHAHWAHYWPELGGACLEIGCGAGRITGPLARSFSRVVALDVSAEMIELARAAAPSHVRFEQVAGTTIPCDDREFDGVFSVHVLQHLDRLDHVGAYLREAFRVLRPGGTTMVHLLLSSSGPSPVRALATELKLRISRRALAAGRPVVHFRATAYRPEEVRALLGQIGFVDVELREFPVRSNGDPHSFWLARKPA